MRNKNTELKHKEKKTSNWEINCTYILAGYELRSLFGYEPPRHEISHTKSKVKNVNLLVTNSNVQ